MLELQLKKLNSRYTAPPKIGLDWLNKILFLNCHGRASMERTLSTDTWGPISREDYFCGSCKEEIKRETIWKPTGGFYINPSEEIDDTYLQNCVSAIFMNDIVRR